MHRDGRLHLAPATFKLLLLSVLACTETGDSCKEMTAFMFRTHVSAEHGSSGDEQHDASDNQHPSAALEQPWASTEQEEKLVLCPPSAAAADKGKNQVGSGEEDEMEEEQEEQN